MILDTLYMMSKKVIMEEGKLNQFQCHSLVPPFTHPFTKDLLDISPSNTRKFTLNGPLCSSPETIRLIRLKDYVNHPSNWINYSDMKIQMLYFILLFKFFIVYAVRVVPTFSPFHHLNPAHTFHTPSESPYYCPCPWVVHKCSLVNPFTIFHPAPPLLSVS